MRHPPTIICHLNEQLVSQVAVVEFESTDGCRWGEEGFKRTIAQGYRGRHGYVAVVNRQVVGFLVFALHSSAAILMHMAVLPSFRRMGIGSQLMGKLKELELESGGRERVEIMTRDHWLDAQLFLKSQGFRGTLHKKAFTDREGEEVTFQDGILFSYRMPRESNGEGPLGALPDDVLSACIGK